ncbi:hypothetical protein [Falsiroseomonas oryzae]|uniref:hypothetical protein n=1 Tax=Falsiroseomonas oryzae TaxID=2766473 RepID=UPI0022EA8255|nr:hypothetical protein [Roseomonas sp. MO-31]
MPIYMPVEGVTGRVTAAGFEDTKAADAGLRKVGPGTLVLSNQNETITFDLTIQETSRPFHDQGVKVYIDVVYNHTADDGGGPRVIVFKGDTDGVQVGGVGDDLIVGGGEDQSYNPGFRGGVSVAVGDLDGAKTLESLLAVGEPIVDATGMMVLLQDGSVGSVGSSVDLF